jgi:multidrug resistance efflux pump
MTLLSSRKRISMKKYLAGILIIAAIAGLLYYFFTRNKEEGNPFLKVSGNIEATEVDVGFKVSGRIMSLLVQEGDWVERGKVLAKLDDEDLLQRLALAQATLKSAQARLDKLLAGSRPEEIREAAAALQQTQFDFENKQVNYERIKSLFERGVIPKDTLKNAEAVRLQKQRWREQKRIISS